MIAEATAVPGYVATLQVRMLHAHMRKLALDRGVGTARHGLPINQIDLGRTWIDFTLTAFTAEEAFGFALSSLETTDLYRDWWYFGHLLGVDLRLIQGGSPTTLPRHAWTHCSRASAAPSAESAVLAEATLAPAAEVTRQLFNAPSELGRPLARPSHHPAAQ